MKKQLILVMLVLACNISVGGINLKQVNDVEIYGSIDRIGQTAKIMHPGLKDVQKGDEVVIELAYLDGTGTEVYKQVEFEGEVDRVIPERPYGVECADGVISLKNKHINTSWKDTDLKTVVKEITDGTQLTLIGELPEIKFTKFSIENSNGAEALNQLKEDYGLMTYLRGNKLFIGLAFTEDVGETNYTFGKNIADSDLKFRSTEDYKLKVKVKSILKDNTIVEAEAGESGGSERTIMVYNISDKTTLKQRAEDELKRLSYSGFEGNITGFLSPYATFGSVVDLVDDLLPERSGKYIAEACKVTFNESGARRKLDLGIKVG